VRLQVATKKHKSAAAAVTHAIEAIALSPIASTQQAGSEADDASLVTQYAVSFVINN
jgi:hypothetical protein